MNTRSATSNARRTLLRRGRDILQRVSKGRSKKAKNIDVMALLSPEERSELADIHLALERIERGIFGVCDGCSKSISDERLLEVPWNSLCAICDVPIVSLDSSTIFSLELPL